MAPTRVTAAEVHAGDVVSYGGPLSAHRVVAVYRDRTFNDERSLVVMRLDNGRDLRLRGDQPVDRYDPEERA